MSRGRGRLSRSSWAGAVSSSSMISLQRSMHSSQMYTPGPAMSFLTWRCDLPQKLQRSCSLPSLARAIPDSFYPDFSETARADSLSGLSPRLVAMGDDRVDDPVVHGFLRAQEEVPLHVARNLFLGLAGVVGVDLLQAPLEADHLACLDLDVGALALEAAGHLVDQNP